MEIVFKNNKIKKQVAKSAIPKSVKARRLKQLMAADTFVDIPNSADTHFLKGDLKNYFAVDFDYPARLICEPVGKFEKDENGQYIKESITMIEILEIKTDYHSK